jgi:hypothetical protein
MAAANHLANTPNTTTGYQTTPFFLMTGRKPTIWPYEFGEVGIVHSPRADDPAVRSEWGIFIGIDSEHPSSLRIYIPSRGLVYSRRKFEPQETSSKSWGYMDRITEITTADMMRDDDILRQQINANDHRETTNNVIIQGKALTDDEFGANTARDKEYEEYKVEDLILDEDMQNTKVMEEIRNTDDETMESEMEDEDEEISNVIDNMNDSRESAHEVEDENGKNAW